MSLEIQRLLGWEALDSRGRPTVGCDAVLAGGATGSVTVPSGASTGRHEAHELRDGADRYAGWGVRNAVRNINMVIEPALSGSDADDARALDTALRTLDGSPSLQRLGANAVLAVSLAVSVAVAEARGVPLFRLLAGKRRPSLPLPMVNIFSGGAHAGRAVDIQDVLFVPVAARSIAEAMEMTHAVRAAAADRLRRAGFDAALVADEGGLAARLGSSRAAVELVATAIEDAGLRPPLDGAIAIDVAASQLLHGGVYRLTSEARELDGPALVGEIGTWCADFPVVSVEDPVGEDDAAGWDAARDTLSTVQIVGDDLFATNAERLAEGSKRGWANAVLVKPNQNGTLLGACDVLRQARAAGYATVVSARSGETEDAWLADVAVGLDAGQIKVGSTHRGERTAKWNRLLRIEAVLGPELPFSGRAALAPNTVQFQAEEVS